MAATVEVRVPDIGEFRDIPIIEMLVQHGDSVKEGQSVVTLESDKTTLDVPTDVAG
jgi:pyruvate/2-oxoglutarate dehydrogenase complex dihydrolipoamide acyltransferase (E2) component